MGRPALGPEVKFQLDDKQQLDALDVAASQHEISRSEMMRVLVRYGLAMRAKNSPDVDQWIVDALSADPPPAGG